MKIAQIYQTLCGLYGIFPPVDIEHYLIIGEHSGDGIIVGNRSLSREALFIRQTGDDLEMGLFIAPAIESAISFGDELAHIDELACAAEGVSHFLYVADRAMKKRCVSKLELELQGEVDKFLIIHLLASARERSVDWDYFARQFANYKYDASLSTDEIERYETASHFAAKYCAFLRERYFNPLRLAGLIENARGFFDRDLEAKLKRLIP